MPAKKKAAATKARKSGSSSAIAKADSVISRKNQNGTVILMRLDRASAFYKIDGIAAEVWASLEAPKSMELVLDYFSKRYPAKAKTLQKDVEALIKKLMKLELISPSKAPIVADISLQGTKKPSEFGGIQEFDLEQIETEVLNESVYIDVFAGSDLAIKTDVKPIRGALAKVVQLEGVTHRWKNRKGSLTAGLIAQQVAEQMPELVRRDQSSGVLAVNYQKLNSYLVEAVKDLHEKVLAQEERIRKLESRLS